MVAVNIRQIFKRIYRDPEGKRCVICDIYTDTMPDTMPEDGTDIDGLGSNYVFAPGTRLIAVEDGKEAIVYEYGGAPALFGGDGT